MSFTFFSWNIFLSSCRCSYGCSVKKLLVYFLERSPLTTVNGDLRKHETTQQQQSFSIQKNESKTFNRKKNITPHCCWLVLFFLLPFFIHLRFTSRNLLRHFPLFHLTLSPGMITFKKTLIQSSKKFIWIEWIKITPSNKKES